MEEIKALFRQLHERLNEEMDGKAYQEFHHLANELVHHAGARREMVMRDWKYDVEFFRNTDPSKPFSFGQCGDHVYWKIIDRVLYVGGKGAMWDFDNFSVDQGKNNVSAPWKGMEYDTVLILNGVTTIGVEAFCNVTLSDVIIPASIVTIKTLAFFDATIERLILPETIQTIEEDALTGFHCVVDTLTVSVNIANIHPFAFFNRDDIIANDVYLFGTLPEDLTPLVRSCLFDDAKRCKIHYPENWDTENASFFEKLSQKFPDSDDVILKDLKGSLIPYSI